MGGSNEGNLNDNNPHPNSLHEVSCTTSVTSPGEGDSALAHAIRLMLLATTRVLSLAEQRVG